MPNTKKKTKKKISEWDTPNTPELLQWARSWWREHSTWVEIAAYLNQAQVRREKQRIGWSPDSSRKFFRRHGYYTPGELPLPSTWEWPGDEVFVAFVDNMRKQYEPKKTLGALKVLWWRISEHLNINGWGTDNRIDFWTPQEAKVVYQSCAAKQAFRADAKPDSAATEYTDEALKRRPDLNTVLDPSRICQIVDEIDPENTAGVGLWKVGADYLNESKIRPADFPNTDAFKWTARMLEMYWTYHQPMQTFVAAAKRKAAEQHHVGGLQINGSFVRVECVQYEDGDETQTRFEFEIHRKGNVYTQRWNIPT